MQHETLQLKNGCVISSLQNSVFSIILFFVLTFVLLCFYLMNETLNVIIKICSIELSSVTLIVEVN